MNERQFDDLELREEPPRSDGERGAAEVSHVNCTQNTFACRLAQRTPICCF